MTTNEEILKKNGVTYAPWLIELLQQARQDEARKIFAELEKKDAEGRSAVFSMEFGISCDCDVCKNYRRIRKKLGVK